MAQKLKLHSPVGADPLLLKWPVPTSEGKDGPEEILDTIRLVYEDYPELKTPVEARLFKDGEDVSNYDYEQTKAMCERYNKVIDSLRLPAKGNPRQKSASKRASMKQLKHILQQCYNHSVKDPEKLNHYEPFSPEVYGETSFELVEQMINYVKFSDCDYFIDLGSGVGQVVLQVSAATNCKFCYGVEKAEWPAEYAVGMDREFRRWMKWYGKEHGEFKIEKGDFLHDSIKEKLSKATIVFVNNFAFGPVVDHELKQRFANCLKEGARIVSSKAFCPLNFRITARNLSDIGTIMQVEELSPLCGAVSWTGKPFAYYVHTIDRTLLEKYFQRLRYPSKRDECEPRKDRKGRPLLSIKDKINGALSAGSDSNSSGRWRRVRGLQRETDTVSPLSAAKVLDFDSGSNSSCTNSAGTPAVDDSSIVYGPTTRRQWNEYVKRPQSQSGTENENDSSTADAAPVDVMTKEQAKEMNQKKKRMKTMKRLNNGALGKRQMQVGKKSEPLSPVKSKAAVKLRPRQKQTVRSSVPKRAAAMSAATTASSITTTTSTVSSNLSAHANGTIPPPSLDSLNLLHAHTIMSTSGKDAGEKVNYNDRRMTETSNAYFKPTVQKQTVSMLEKEAGFLQMIETMKQRFLSFLTFMQTPEYRAMLLLQIEQEKRKNTNLKGQTESLERDISILQKDGVRLIKDRLKEMGLKAETPRELISQAKDIMLCHHELKSQTASLGAQINALQTEHNQKITAYRKALDRKFAMRQSENGFSEHTYHMLDKESLDQQRLLANINRLHTELQHLQNVNRPYVVRPECDNTPSSGVDIGLGLATEGKGSMKANGLLGHQSLNSCIVKEKLDMKENYDNFGTVLTVVKKEVTAALQNNSASQTNGPAVVLETRHVPNAQSTSASQETADKALTVSVDLKSNNPAWCAKDASVQSTRCSSIQTLKTPEKLVTEVMDRGSNMSQMLSSWSADVRKDGAVTSTNPRILPPGMKIDIKKPSRLNGLNCALKAKVCQPSNYTLLQNSENHVSQSYKADAHVGFSTIPAFNLYTENEKSAAEDLILLKESLSTPTINIEPQGPLSNKAPTSSPSSTLSNMEHVLGHISDSNASSTKHSSHDIPVILAPNKPHTGSSNSLGKDSSVSCAITTASSTSHVFAQVPVANLSQTGSSQFASQNNQLLGTASSKLLGPLQNKVRIVTNLPRNGLVKHKNYDTSLIQRPVKVRTVEARNEVKLSMPSALSSAFRAPLQAPSLGLASGTNLAHVLKSDSGHFMSNQSFLNAHMSQTVVVSSGNGSTVGSTSLPFVTIQSPHAIPVSQGSNGVQPSLLKILQQKPQGISPKSSGIFNGTASSSSTGSLIAVSPTVSSQATLAQADSIGQAVKILPPRDAKGHLYSPERCSLVVSEFDAPVPVASPEPRHMYSKRTYQECEQQGIPSDCDLESASDSDEEVAESNSCSKDGIFCTRKRDACSCYSGKLTKSQGTLPPKISKLSSDSDISSLVNSVQTVLTNPTPESDMEPITVKQKLASSFYKQSGNILAVILKREARVEKMAECISDGEVRGKTMTSTKSSSVVFGKVHNNFQNKDMQSEFAGSTSENTSQDKPMSGHNSDTIILTNNQISAIDDVSRKHKSPMKVCLVDSKKSSLDAKLINMEMPVDKNDATYDPEISNSSWLTDKTNSGACDSRPRNHLSRRDHSHHSSSYQLQEKCSSYERNKVDIKHVSKEVVKSSEFNILQSVDLVSTECLTKTGQTSKKSKSSQASASMNDQQEKHLVKSEARHSSAKSESVNVISPPDKQSYNSKLGKKDRDCHILNFLPHAGEERLGKDKTYRSSPKLHKDLPSKSVKIASRKSFLTDIECSSLISKNSKPDKTHSKEYKNHSSSKSPDSSVQGHTKQCSDKVNTKSGSQRDHEKKRSSLFSRTSSPEKRNQNSTKVSRNHSSSKRKVMSPGPPQLERAVSPPRYQSKSTVENKMSKPNSKEIDSTQRDSDKTKTDLWSACSEHSDDRCLSNHHNCSTLPVCSKYEEKTTTSEYHGRCKESLLSPISPSHENMSATECHNLTRETTLSPKPQNHKGKITSKWHSHSREPSLSPNPSSHKGKTSISECHIQSRQTSLSDRLQRQKGKISTSECHNQIRESSPPSHQKTNLISECHSPTRKVALNDKGKISASKCHNHSRESSLSPVPRSKKGKTSTTSESQNQSRETAPRPLCHKGKISTLENHFQLNEPTVSPKPSNYKIKTSSSESQNQAKESATPPKTPNHKGKSTTSEGHSQLRESSLSLKPVSHREKTSISECHNQSRETSLSPKPSSHKRKTSTLECHKSRQTSLSPKPSSHKGKTSTSECHSQSRETSLSPKPSSHKGKTSTSECHSQSRETSLSPKPSSHKVKTSTSECHSQSIETSLTSKPLSHNGKTSVSECHKSRQTSLSPKPSSHQQKTSTSKCRNQSRETSLSPKPSSHKQKTSVSECQNQSRETSLSPEPGHMMKTSVSKYHNQSRETSLSPKPPSHKGRTSVLECQKQSRETSLSPKPGHKMKTSILEYHNQSRETSLSPKPSSHIGKTSVLECQKQSRETSLSPKPPSHKRKISPSECCSVSRESISPSEPSNISSPKAKRKTVSPKPIRDSMSGIREPTREGTLKERDLKSLRNMSYKKCTSNTETNTSEINPKNLSNGSEVTKSRCTVDSNKSSIKYGKEHKVSEKGFMKSISNSSLQCTNIKDNKNELCKKGHQELLTEKFPSKDAEQVGTTVKVDAEKIPQADIDKIESNGEFVLSANLDSPYGMLTPISVSWSCQMEEDRNTDISGGDNLHQKDGKFNLGIKDVHSMDSFESHSEVIKFSALEPESFPFPPTPGKTPRSSSVPCSPCGEMNTQTSEEPNEMVSEEVKRSDFVDSVFVRKGPQTPPGSPLFNHQSQSRSRSPSVSSSSSRDSSCDTSHSTSSSSSFSDSSSDDTKRRKQRANNYKTPPRKLSTLIPPLNLRIGSPSKAAVLYSPMPSPNINGFNYGQIRLGMSSSTAPVFGNHGVVVGTSVLSPLSVSTQQSPGYQMVTSDSLRSPNMLLRSPLSGGMIRQHPVFPNSMQSPVSSTASTLSPSSSQGCPALQNTFVHSCRSVNSLETGGDTRTESALFDQKLSEMSPDITKVLPVAARRLSSVLVDSYTADFGKSSSKIEKTISANPESSYKVMDANGIVKDYNANNTSLRCSRATHLQETLTTIDYNQNLCQLSTSCCTKFPSVTTACAVIGSKQNSMASESASLCCNGSPMSQFSVALSGLKNNSEAILPYSSPEGLVLENDTYESSPLTSYQSSSTSPFISTMLPPNDCTDTESFTRNMKDGQSVAHKISIPYLECTLQQQQEMQYHPLTATNHQPNSAEQTQQLTHSSLKKQQPVMAKPLPHHHLPLFHQNSSPPSPPPLPYQQLHIPRPPRQKSPMHSPRASHYNPFTRHAYKGHNLGNRRMGFGSRLPHSTSNLSHVSSQVYQGPFFQGPPYLSKPRHMQPPGPLPGFRVAGDSDPTEIMHTGLMDYPLHGVLTKPYGASQWNHTTNPHYVGSGPGGLGRSFHQNNHLYYNKHHH